jgi:hypothetical protein
MEYVMYAVFGFWYLCSLQELAVAIIYLVRRNPSPLRPTSYYFAVFVFGTTVTSVLLWLYSSGRLEAWPTIIIGTIVFLAEAIYSAWSKSRLVRLRSE